MRSKVVALQNCRFEILMWGDEFAGIGRIHIGDTLVRSGRLPLRVESQTFQGLELFNLRLLDVRGRRDEVRIVLEARFRPMLTKMMRDHSFDPIHNLGDWDTLYVAGTGRLDLVLRRARDNFDGIEFNGFSYHYEYRSKDVLIFFLLDRASWELDGDIVGATVFSQTSCSPPVATFAANTRWSTEGRGIWPNAEADPNPVMTHNLPRWASHQAFDFQCKNNHTLLGVFERVDLIRSVICRDAGKPELKTFDKHIFDQALTYSTSPKKILLNTAARTNVAQRNLWTRVFDEVHGRARDEFGLREEPLVPRLQHNLWINFKIDDYRKDFLPCAENLGFRAKFIDNMNRNDTSEQSGNNRLGSSMCCSHAYEINDRNGGRATLWNFADRALSLPGKITDLTTGQKLPTARTYRLESCHTYAITGTELPTQL